MLCNLCNWWLASERVRMHRCTVWCNKAPSAHTCISQHVITHDPANCACALRQPKIIAYFSTYLLIYNQSGEKGTFLYLFIHLRTKQWRSVHIRSVVGHDTMKSGRWLTSISEETMPQLSPVPWQFVTKFPPKSHQLTPVTWCRGHNVTNHSH